MPFFGYQLHPPYLTCFRVSAVGEVVQTRVVDVPRATMMHDFAITRNHVIFMDLPVVFDHAQAARAGRRGAGTTRTAPGSACWRVRRATTRPYADSTSPRATCGTP
ncbi:carotenoid oxygenase family protein [Nonomuraea spiralis]|uniref:Dioxygenase n=1 Tax=Nonomuraea spiralis TaxID=46182 RepID=A0ABV5IRC2_9ACTN